MNRSQNRLFRRLLISSVVMLSSYALKQAIEAGYRKAIGEEAPKNPERTKSDWTKTIIYSAATGMVLGVVKAVIREGVKVELDRRL